MSSRAKGWRISRIANQARRAIEALNPERLSQALEALEVLQVDPFSGDTKKIKGKEGLYRLRQGDFRVYFRIIPESREIEILLFDQRGSIKDKTIDRL